MVISVYRLFLHAMVILSLWIMYSNVYEKGLKFVLATILFVYYLMQLHKDGKSK